MFSYIPFIEGLARYNKLQIEVLLFHSRCVDLLSTALMATRFLQWRRQSWHDRMWYGTRTCQHQLYQLEEGGCVQLGPSHCCEATRNRQSDACNNQRGNIGPNPPEHLAKQKAAKALNLCPIARRAALIYANATMEAIFILAIRQSSRLSPL